MDRSAERFLEILNLLAGEYPETPSLLDHNSPFELLVGVILSAQTTDQQVNHILPSLLQRFPDANRLATAAPQEVETIIHSVGFFRRKARSIIGAAAHLVEYHQGRIPATMDELVKIPGVGRKSAGVLLLHVYGKPAIIVDTHFGRVVRRLGFSSREDPTQLERDVAAILPPDHWNQASMLLNYHGRRYCFARKPACADCPVSDLCPFYKASYDCS